MDNQAAHPPTLFYIHDPMCSWCWGFSPTWCTIRDRLPPGLRVEYVLGGLAPDTDAPMPLAMQTQLQQTWRTIAERLGTQFNFDFWTACQPRRATYPACRAVIAAQRQNTGEAMIAAIQHAYYLEARNPSEDDTLRDLAHALRLDDQRFTDDLNSPATSQELTRQIAHAQGLGADGFPSLIYQNQAGNHRIQYDYLDPDTTLEQIRRLA